MDWAQVVVGLTALLTEAEMQERHEDAAALRRVLAMVQEKVRGR